MIATMSENQDDFVLQRLSQAGLAPLAARRLRVSSGIRRCWPCRVVLAGAVTKLVLFCF